MIIAKHFPILQVLLPLFGALFSALTFRPRISHVIAVISVLSSLLMAIYYFDIANVGVFYAIGDHKAPIGIEYRLDNLNQPAIIYVNSVLLFVLTFCHKLFNDNVVNYLTPKYRHLIYAILLFAHTGYIGMLSTNDLFNLYVFIEISSLSAYALMAQGADKEAPAAAFDYLILGTIGATLILISVGLLFAHTGSLNISDIKQLLQKSYGSKTVIVACCFFVVGATLKMAFFPMHFWMIRSYRAAPAVILIYLAGISAVMGCYIIVRFLHFALVYDLIAGALHAMLRPTALVAIVSCSFFALRSVDLRKIIAYSAAAGGGYALLLMFVGNGGVIDSSGEAGSEILKQFLLADSINKIGLFLIIACISSGYFLPVAALIMLVIFSAGLPLSALFLLKIKMLQLFLSKNSWVDFTVIIMASVMSLFYHYNFALLAMKEMRQKMESDKVDEERRAISNFAAVFAMIILQILALCVVVYR